MTSSADSPFRLGEWTVRPRENAIERDGDVETIEPKLMEVLVFLAQEPSRVHLRQEILDSVWRDTFVTDEVLTNAIWELRRALGDDAREPRYIRTIPRKGYGLVVPATPLSPRAVDDRAARPELTGLDDEDRTPARSRARTVPRWALAALAAGLLMAIAWWWRGGHPNLIGSGPTSIAVLPIEALSSDPAHRHFAEALTDTLTAELASREGFEVASRSTVVELARAGVPAVEIARRLDVESFLEGTLSFSDTGRARLSSQLIDRRRDRHLWSEVLEVDVRDSLGAERRLSRRVVVGLTQRGIGGTPGPAAAGVASAREATNSSWTFRTGSEVWSDPTVVDETLLIGSTDGQLYALDRQTGVETWRLATPGSIRDAIAIDGSTAYLTTNGYAFAVDVAQGTERWRRRISLIAPLVLDPIGRGVLVGGAYDRQVYGLDPRSGETLWAVPTKGEARTAAALHAGEALVGTDRGELLAIDLTTGRRIWERVLESAVVGTISGPQDGSFVATDGGYLYHLAQDGSEIWRRFLGARLGLAPELYEGILYQGTGDGRLVALDSSDGSPLWTFGALDAIATIPRIHGDLVWVGSLDHRLYAVDRVAGTERWSFATGGWVVARPLVTGDLVVTAGLDGTVYALPIDGPGLPRDPDDWPDPGAPRFVGSGPGPELLWRLDLGRPANLAVDGTTLVAATEGHLAAFDTRDGSRSWTLALAGGSARSPVLVGERVVAVTREGTVLAVERSSGVELWRQELGARSLALPVVVGDRIYVGDLASRLNVLDLGTGTILWRAATEEGINGAAVVLDDRVVVGSCGESVWAFDHQGEVLWTTHAGECVVTDGVRFEDTLIFGSFNGDLLALEAANGVRRWTFGAEGQEIWYRPLLLADRLYFGSGDYHLYAVEASTGHEVWRFRTDNRALTQVASHERLILFGSHDRHLYAVDRETGEEVWRLETTRDVQKLAVAEGRLYFAGDDGYVFAYQL